MLDGVNAYADSQPEVRKVCDGVWVAIGFGLANSVLFTDLHGGGFGVFLHGIGPLGSDPIYVGGGLELAC